MEKNNNFIHCRAPTAILTGFFAGITFTAGQHIFYDSLDRTALSTDVYSFSGLGLSKQQSNISPLAEVSNVPSSSASVDLDKTAAAGESA